MDICTHITLCWNTAGLFPICLVYCKHTVFGTLTCWIPFCIINARLYLIQSFQPCSFSATKVPPHPTKIREWRLRLYNTKHFIKWTTNGLAVNCNCILLRAKNTHNKCYCIKNIYKNFKSIFKKCQLVNCSVILNPVQAVSHLMSPLCGDRIIVMVKL